MQDETLVFSRAAEQGSGRRGAHLSGPVASRGPGGAEPGPAGRVPGGRGARLSAQPGRLGKQHGDPAPPPPPRHPAHAPLSNQNGSSPGPGREAGPPSSPALPEACRSPWAPGTSGTERGDLFPARKGLGRRKGSWGVLALGGGGSEQEGVQPRIGRGGRGNKAPDGGPPEWGPTHTLPMGPPPRRWGVGATLLKPPASALGLEGKGEGIRDISARGASGGERRGRRRRWAEGRCRGQKPRRPERDELAGKERRGAGLRCSGISLWLFRGVGALLPEKVSMAFIAQCSSGQSTKA